MQPDDMRDQLAWRHARVKMQGGQLGGGEGSKSIAAPPAVPPALSTVDDLFESISSSYFMLRRGLAVVAFLLPIALWIVAGPEYLQTSISAYYHFSHVADGMSAYGAGAARNIFVGVLWMVGAFLYFYKGYSWQEDVALNIAGIAAIGIALFPMDWPEHAATTTAKIHYSSAVIFFVAIAYVCVFRSGDTLSIMEDGDVRRRFKRIYSVLGILMIACPVAVLLIHFLSGSPEKNYVVLLVELAGVWVFSTFWITKSREIALIER
ncbi:hypothetical protein D0Z70_08900 [Sphingobium terrigena]|uniref:DUF998 domain-containing protein n=1 Tax=Sphingobium terrigena TaxID=2304063 RepID=A0A418YTX0_9SPHN|nr:DUF998 domain-containing protein [Sphingobium terrigena]RJG55509.1 hypothetical protein D0Z70_08900 [Sphingobium terrigena]